uniref:Retrovirus-related Pol polyprotein from transposon TNT 1-94 n=2 Tax=Talaromyces marneffei PM1 TaxID=1077442 RepID=A0A093UNR6_TALMA
MSSEDKNQTILSSKSDWERWLRPIESKALGTEVWDYINPDLKDFEKKELTEPAAPKKEINETSEDFQYRRDMHKRALAKHDIKEANIASIRPYIFRTIDSSAYLLVNKKSNVYDILSELQKRYKPDASRERFDIWNEWTTLKAGPAGKKQFNAWIKSWIETYNRARQYQLPGIGSDEKFAMMEFMHTIRRVNETFYSTWYEAVSNDREKSFIELVTKFEDFTRAERGTSVYATLGGNNANSNDSNQGNFNSQNRNNNKAKKCWCGELKSVHERWEKCPYLNEQIREDNWTPDPNIVKKIAELAASRKGLKDFIDQHKKQGRPPVNINAVFTTSGDDDPLVDSVIHDGGATESISNNFDRMEDFVPERIRIRGFGGHLWAQGRGTMIVWATAPGDKEKSQQLRIRNALYCPEGPVSLVSGKALNRSGVFKDEEKNILYSRNGGYHVIATLQPINDQAVIEYNAPKRSTAYVLKKVRFSTIEPHSKASLEKWHKRLGHPNDEVINTSNITLRVLKLIQQPGRFVRASGDHEAVHVHSKRVLSSAVIDFEKEKARQGLKIKVFHTDGERSLNEMFIAHIRNEGIQLHQSAPYSPQQNGPAERSGGVIIAMARTILTEANLPENLWPLAIDHIVYLLQRLPKKKLGWKTPYELIQSITRLEKSMTLNLGHIKIFGCKAYRKIPSTQIPRLQKMAPRAEIGYLVGYDASNIFKIWIPEERSVIRARDVEFDEDAFFDPTKPVKIRVREAIEEDDYRVETITTRPPIEEDSDDDIFQQMDENRSCEHKALKSQGVQVQGRQNKLKDKLNTQNKLNSKLDIPNKLTSRSANETPFDSGTTRLPTPSSPEIEHSQDVNTHIELVGEYSTPMTIGRQESNPSGILRDFDAEASEQLQLEATQEPSERASRANEISATFSETNILPGKRSRRAPKHRDADIYFTSAFTLGRALQDERKLIPEVRLHRDELPPEPQTWQEMLKLPEAHREGFTKAGFAEYSSLVEMNTFEKVHWEEAIQQENYELLGTRWVFTYKLDSAGFLLRYKARLVIRGDLQMSWDDTYSATISSKAIRALIALATAFGYKMWQHDMITAYLNAGIDKNGYFIRMPQGVKGDPDIWLRLRKALYGLKQSPLLWQKEFTAALIELGFEQISEEICLFRNKDGIILFFYVDDVVTLFKPEKEAHAKELWDRLMSKYPARAMGELSWFLGTRIIRDNEASYLCQDSYIEEVAKRYNLDTSKRPSTPCSPTMRFVKYDGQASKAVIKLYQQKVGSIIYVAIITRPDVAFVAAKLSKFMQNPSPAHMQAIDRVILYLYKTRFLAICYKRIDIEDAVQAASDASFADNPDRRSSGGFIFKLFGGPIDWSAKKQKTVSTSTTEAELLALSEAAKQLLWWIRFFQAIEFDPEQGPITIECDNRQTVRAMIKNEAIQTRLRHIDIHNHWLREKVQNKEINIRWTDTNSMPADGLTKPLLSEKHALFIEQLGLIDISRLIPQANLSN